MCIRDRGMSALALGVISDSLQAVEAFTEPNTPCGQFYSAGLQMDCSTMESKTQACYDQLVDAGIKEVALAFNKHASALVTSCTEAREEMQKKDLVCQCEECKRIDDPPWWVRWFNWFNW